VPNIKSAKKRVLTIQKKAAVNRSTISEMKTAIKKFNNAIDTTRIDDAEKLLPATMSVIDSAAAKGVIHKNNAANKKSALSKRLYEVKSGQKTIVIKKDNKTIAAEKALAAKEAKDAIKAENAKKAAERAAAKVATADPKDKKKASSAKKPDKPVKEVKAEPVKKEKAPAVKTEEPVAKPAAKKAAPAAADSKEKEAKIKPLKAPKIK
jgi:small subunit ribosomal protein S20